MADINATDLTPETAATLDGSEEFVMFDNVEGKRGELDTVGDYIVQHCDADGNGNTAAQLAGGAQADATEALGDIGDISDLITTDKTDLVSAVNEVKGQADDNTTALQTKAEVDGAYEAMTVGNAEQLVSNIRVTDTDPYLFRTSGGSLEIGDREYPTLVGGSVVVNQLADKTSQTVTAGTQTNVYFTNKQWGVPVVQGHKYLVLWNQEQTLTSVTRNVPVLGGISTPIYGPQATDNARLSKGEYSWIMQSPETKATAGVYIWCHTPSADVTYDKFRIYDLTQRLGTTIADYIYALEQGTAGAGVAFCKKYGIGVGYTAHNAGTLQSTTPTKHKTVGFNQWDEEWELGAIDLTTGANTNSSSSIRSKNYIPVTSSTVYSVTLPTGTMAVASYDADKNFVANLGGYTNKRTFTTPANCAYIRFYVYNGYGTTYNHDICINLHWDGERDGEYEPYTKHEYDLGNDTLRGVFELNNGELKANGDVKTPDGTIQRKWGYIHNGYSRGSLDSSGKLYAIRTLSPGAKVDSYGICCVNNKLISAGLEQCRINADNGIRSICAYAGSLYAGGFVGSESDLDALLPTLEVVYLLATPTEEEGTAFQSPQIVSNWGTEEYTEANGIVVGHSTEYPQDLKAKVESAPNNPSADGDYIVKRENGENTYVPLVIPQELPNAPSTDGTYRLKCTVSGGAATYSWEA